MPALLAPLPQANYPALGGDYVQHVEVCYLASSCHRPCHKAYHHPCHRQQPLHFPLQLQMA